MTYGNSYQPAGHNAQMAQKAFAADDSDSDDGKTKKIEVRVAPAPVAPIAMMQQPPSYGPPGMPYMQSPVHAQYYGHSPVPYGMSPVAVYPAAPWNAMPASPVAVQVPEYIKKQVKRIGGGVSGFISSLAFVFGLSLYRCRWWRCCGGCWLFEVVEGSMTAVFSSSRRRGSGAIRASHVGRCGASR